MLSPERQALPPSNLPLEVRTAPLDTEFDVRGHAASVLVQDRIISGECHRRENRGAYRAEIGGLSPGEYLVRLDYIGDIDTDTYPRPDLERLVSVR